MITFINDDGDSINYTGEFLITKQVANFKDFKIKGDVSITFTVPNTSDNRKALGYYGMNQLDSPVFSSNSFNLVRDGNTLMRGNLVIESDTGKELNLYFISGNANWFRLLDFSCKDVRNNGYNVRWTRAWMDHTRANKTGIIFPFIDWMFGRQKFDNEYWLFNAFDDVIDPLLIGGLYTAVNQFPCLYVNTLINEISKQASIKIEGTLIEDSLYKSIVITPDSAELYNQYGRISTFNLRNNSLAASQGINDLIHIQDIAPDIKAIDMIKWLCVTFGCVPVFDVYSQTLTLNIIDKMDKANAEDWSEYIQSYVVRYNQYQNNYIRLAEAPEDEITFYNIGRDVKYGELNITTSKSDGSSLELYESPFAPAKDDVGTTPIKYATPFVQLYDLEDLDPIEYTSVSIGTNGFAQFNCPFNFDFSSISEGDNIIIRVDDDNATYDGYHVVIDADATSILTGALFLSNSTGTFYIQRITPKKSNPRILVCMPDLPVTYFQSKTYLGLYQDEITGSITRAAYAYYAKPHYTDYSYLNGNKTGMIYGPVDGVIDTIVEERAYQKIKRALNNPTIEAYLLLPEKVFQEYNFDNFVFIKHKDLQGYFLVNKIENYKNGTTPVRVDLLYVD